MSSTIFSTLSNTRNAGYQTTSKNAIAIQTLRETEPSKPYYESNQREADKTYKDMAGVGAKGVTILAEALSNLIRKLKDNGHLTNAQITELNDEFSTSEAADEFVK
jgi:hypothetical protein